MNANELAANLRARMTGIAQAGQDILTQAQSEGRDSLNKKERKRADALVAEYEALKVKRDNLLEIAAEDAATDAFMSQSPILAANRAATGERTERVGHTRTVVTERVNPAKSWAYRGAGNSGVNATVARGESFGAHPLVRNTPPVVLRQTLG